MKTIVLTGATSGIGREVALHLLKSGHRVISNTRNVAKSESVKAELIEASSNNNLVFYEADFTDFESVRRFADSIKNDFPAIDILINNAGTWEMKFIETRDGIETNLQVNHLSPMLLTLLLLPHLEKSPKAPKARIINTSSGAHRRNILDFDNIEWRNKPYDGVATYSQSKLLNILFSLHLKKMLASKEISVNTVHPGFVKTALFDKMGQRNWSGVPNAADGARSTIYAALSPDLEGVSGKYFYLETEDLNLSLLAKRDDLAEKLWEISMNYISEFLA